MEASVPRRLSSTKCSLSQAHRRRGRWAWGAWRLVVRKDRNDDLADLIKGRTGSRVGISSLLPGGGLRSDF